MKTGDHYYFKISNWLKNGAPNLSFRYDLAHFEVKGWILQGIREGHYALTNSRQHKSKKNHFIKEIIINIPDLHLLRSSSLTESDYQNLVKELGRNEFNEQIEKSSILISTGKITLPFLHDNESLPSLHVCNANFHLSHEYFYISCIEKIPEYESPLYFQSKVFNVELLDLESNS